MEDKEEHERGFKQVSQLDHAKLKPGMYIGSIEIQTLEMYVPVSYEPAANEPAANEPAARFVLKKVRFSPGLLKIIDEILVNAIDHYINYPKKVKNIDIHFDTYTGAVSIRNDGPGVGIIKVDTLNDGSIYKPQAVFSQFLAGDNLEAGAERITGGAHGLGAKLTAAYSNVFSIETRDNIRKKLYKQTFKNRLLEIGAPEIIDQAGAGYTLITFLPVYDALGYKTLDADSISDIDQIIKARAYQAAAFVKCNITYQGAIITIPNFQDFAYMFLENDYGLYSTTLTHTDKKLNMEVCIGISDGKARQVSIVNGIWVYMGGNHIKHIQNEIMENIRPLIEKELKNTKNKFNPNMVLNNIFIFTKCSMVNPEFNSQSKEKITTPIEKFKIYKFSKKEWKSIWVLLEPHVMETILGKIKDKKQKKVIRGKVILEKGDDAKYAGHRTKSRETTLIICEGDSAMGLVTRGINHKKTILKKDYYGTFSIQGVPINARKESVEKMDKKNNTLIRIRNEKLKNNKRINELVKILGLDYEKKYTFNTHEGAEEFKTLRYGRVVAAVDQDEDGKGQIFGLLLNFFVYFWPALAEWGYIKRFNTPIIRAYPVDHTKLVQEFCTLFEFREWEQKECGVVPNSKPLAKAYKIRYYKGLASHDVSEVSPMFNDFEKKLYTYDFDEKAEENLEIYFGKEAELRKKVLCNPIDPDDEIKDEIHIPISKLLRTDVKEFQLDNITRKLPHIMDGLVPARRKAFYAARDTFKTENAKEMKVCNFTGIAISKTNYHHGDASLSATIIKMAQSFVGARNLPLFIGIGEFGSRIMGGQDHGSPRYVYVKLNYKLTEALYPRIDDFLLPYHFDEGDRCEPVYYVPILPTILLENMSIPATGWKADIWARDYKAVLKNARYMIKGDTTKCKSLPIWLRGNKSHIRTGSDKKTYLVGRYTYDPVKSIIRITELPPSVYNKSYIKTVAFNKEELRQEFRDYYDYSNYDEVSNIDEIDIQFDVEPGTIEELGDKKEDTLFHPIEEFMKLKLAINSHINVITKEGCVKEYKYYASVFNEWFHERKELYRIRITRQIILSRLMIRYLENIIRFSKERDTYAITNRTPENEFIQILHTHKYDTFNRGLLMNPKYIDFSTLESVIINSSDASYDYIIMLTYRQLLQEACSKREDELKQEQERLQTLLDDCGEFIGQKTWLRELDDLEKIIDHGLKYGWKHKRNAPRFASGV